MRHPSAAASRLILIFLCGSGALRAVESAGPVVLEPVTVLGSRLPRTEGDGIAPVNVFDRDLIAASGALRVADFLNLLPQNYTGASSGRGSAANEFNPEFGVRTESLQPSFNFVLGASAVPLGQSGVSGANLRGLGSGSTLVLVDGRRLPIAAQGNTSMDTRQGFVDLAAIPLGMIERVEVLTDGASALYGSDAIGGVINLVTRKNYTGAELAVNYRGTFEGGGRERRVTFLGGLTTAGGRLRGTITLDVFDRAKLTAAQRDFSREQDHRARVVGYDAQGAPIPGTDLRLNWGYPAVVQARTGTLNGVVGPGGATVPIALVPDGAVTTPAAAQFVPGTGNSANGARESSTADYLALVPPQESRNASGTFDYRLGPTMWAQVRFAAGDVRGQFDAQPPVSDVSASTGFGNFSTLVPATINGQPNALNPFGQDVLVGLVHAEFGPLRQTTHTRTRSAGAGVGGALPGGWSWDAAMDWSRQNFAQRNLTFDPAKFTAALAATAPAQRFNPFIDARAAGPIHAPLYAAMTTIAAYDGLSELAAFTFVADGPLPAWRGRQPRLAVGGDYDYARHRAFDSLAGEQSAQRRSHAVFAELAAPLVTDASAHPFVHRLELQLAGRYEHQGRAGDSFDPKMGVAWAPARSWLLRASLSTGFRAPTLTEYETPIVVYTDALEDPRRAPALTPNVAVTTGSRQEAKPETSRHESGGVVLRPVFAPGWELAFDYTRTRERDLLQALAALTILQNEAAFPGRITRAPPTADDTANHQPGALTAVDATFVNFGETRHDALDLRLSWAPREKTFGRFRASVSATHLLAARLALVPGNPAIDLIGDTAAPPRWSAMGTLLWSLRAWNAGLFVRHVGGFASNNAGNATAPQGCPAWTTISVNLGYTFQRTALRGIRIGAGVGNLFNRAPPFSDTVFGFNGGLHDPLGRTYTLSATIPLGR